VLAGDELTVADSGELLWKKSMEFSQLRSPRTNSSHRDAQNGLAHLHGHFVDAGMAAIDGSGWGPRS
jgi:hypothetical protein